MTPAAAVLAGAGMANPARVRHLIEHVIRTLELDLSGLTVLTEAASGPYLVTPVIALMAGAQRVLALTAASSYASAEAVIAQTRALEQLCGTPRAAEIHDSRAPALFEQANLVTNLGFVRPLDAAAISRMQPGSAISLMCEAWEYRASDLDLAACRDHAVQVLATNEDFAQLDVFAYSGWLCMKLLFDAGIEVHKSRAVIVGGDKFGRVIEHRLAANGVRVALLDRLDVESVRDADVLIVADYTRTDQIIGDGGDLSALEVARAAPWTTVIQFAGRIDVAGLRAANVHVIPGGELPARRMARTLGHLGARPVIELHAAGLKVGEMALRGTLATSPFAGLAQSVALPDR